MRPILQSGQLDGLDDDCDGFRLRLFARPIAETFDAGLAKFARVTGVGRLRLKPEGSAVVAVPGRRSRIGISRQVQPARRHSEIGPETKLGTVRVGEDVGARAQALADDVEKHVGRLDDRRRNGFIVRVRKDGQENPRLRFKLFETSRR